MKNKEKAIIAMVSMIGSGLVGVALAFLGFRYWSLAWQQVLFITITNIGRYHYSQWRKLENKSPAHPRDVQLQL